MEIKMMRLRLSVSPAILAVLVGCAQVNVDQRSIPVLKAGRSVEFGKDATANVGSVIFSEYNYYSAQVAVARTSFSDRILLATVTVPAGSRLAAATVDGKTAFCTLRSSYFVPGEARSVCFFDNQKNGIFDKYYIMNTLSSIQYDASLPYAVEDVSSDTAGYKYELLYQGVSANVLKISYREYSNNFARPAFQQDLSYTLEIHGPTDISFRGARLRVHGANNNEIRYVVNSGFADARASQ